MNPTPGRDDFDAEYEPFDAGSSDDDVEDDEVEVDDETDDDEDDDLDDDEDDDDDLDDAELDEIDFVIAAYAEDGARTAVALSKELANDLDALITQLRRIPGEAGVVGFVSLVDEMFLVVRVRGPRVQVLLSDGSMAAEWPIARDVADFLNVDVPEDDDEVEPMGDLDILADVGISEVAMAQFCDDVEDAGTDEVLAEVADHLGLGRAFRKAVEAELQA